MVRKIVFIAAVLLLQSACAIPHKDLSTCAIPHKVHDTNQAYSEHQFNNYDVALEWKSEKTDTGIQIKGTILNCRANITFTAFELTATLLDENGTTLAQNKYNVAGPFAGSESFRLDIPLENKEKLRTIRFLYSYGNGEDIFTGNFKSVP